MYFDKNTNVNITAIVGKNGSGKSSIINFIKDIFCGNHLVSAFEQNEFLNDNKREFIKIDLEDSMTVIIKVNEKSYLYYSPNELNLQNNEFEVSFIYKGKAFNHGDKWCRSKSDNDIKAPFENTTFIDIEQYGDIMCLHEGGFSLNHKNESGKNMYCFSSYLATMDVMDSFEIILFVMEELLKSFMVINEINSSETPYCHYKKKKKCYKFNSFLQNYFIFYKAHNIGDIAFINENKKMYTVTRVWT